MLCYFFIVPPLSRNVLPVTTAYVSLTPLPSFIPQSILPSINPPILYYSSQSFLHPLRIFPSPLIPFPLSIIRPFSSLSSVSFPLFLFFYRPSVIHFSSVFTCYACAVVVYKPAITKSSSLTQFHQSALSFDQIHFLSL